MKTAMEMLEEFVCLNNYTEIDLINKIQELLPIEKQQIKDKRYSKKDMLDFAKFTLLGNHTYKSYEYIFKEWLEQLSK